MEVSGIGKLSPNMLMVGFQEKWFSCPQVEKLTIFWQNLYFRDISK